jgi:hypothetical protein
VEGWSQRSIFGWDEQLGSWWAQLWRDGSTSALPDVWIADAGAQVSRLVQLVTDRIGLPFDVVDWALAESLEPPSERSWRLDIAGWSHHSTIGWSPADGWSARLWADDSTGAYPDIDIRPVGHDQARLLRAVADQLELPVGDIDCAVAQSAP